MIARAPVLAYPIAALAALGLLLPLHAGDGPMVLASPLAMAGLLLILPALGWPRSPDGRGWLVGVVAFVSAVLVVFFLPEARVGTGFWLLVAAVALAAIQAMRALAHRTGRPGMTGALIRFSVPLIFGLWLLFLWEVITRAAGVPPVLLPPPSMIGARIADSLSVLAADFEQTFLKAVLAGYVIGCSAGFLTALIADRVPFLRRGLLPIGNLVSALPIVGIAPIMVMWFGFDWPSKAAVVVVMTFFPMLVNTVAGLSASGAMERDLMRTYGSSHWATLFKLRLPAALPFIFNALKINSTLALIGAIVAEFFGTPIVGMGFRISTEVGRMNIDMVWAEIAMAALAGSLFYGAIAVLERSLTFWHPSYRR